MNFIMYRSRIWILFLYILVATVFFINWFDIPEVYQTNYIVLLVSYILVGGLMCYRWITKKASLFEPFTIVSILYLMLMLIYPMYDYIRLNLMKGGVDNSSGCIEGTLLFVISYLAFFLGYVTNKPLERIKKHNFFSSIDSLSDKTICKIMIVVWLVSIAGALYGQVNRGFSLNYILSMGSVDADGWNISSSSGKYLFLLMLNPTAIVSAISIFVFSKNKYLKFFIMGITLLVLFMRGSRMLMIVMLGALIVYYYVRNKKTPSLKKSILVLSLALFVITSMQIARGSIYMGRDFRNDLYEKLVTVDAYMAPFESDFSTYKVYYGIINAIPEKMDYLYGRGIFGYTAALIIPRSLWPNKPDAPEREIVLRSLGQTAVDSGNAYPNIGTFYSEFGWIGSVIFMFLYGRLLSNARKLYMLNSRSALILYACLWPFCFQLTMRSISNAVYVLGFGILPFIVVWLYKKLVFVR